jgi:branched-chain amino acid aminotransferase
MPMPYDKATLIEAHKEVVRSNKLESCYLRPIAFYGSEKMGVSPRGAATHVSIAAWPWGAYLGEEGMEKGIRVKTSSYSRHHVNVNMARAKFAGTYANSILANMEATETATTRPCCSTSTASSPRAPARTCSSSRTA